MKKVESRFNKQVPNFFQNYQHYPDPKKHQLISFIKSGVRLLGYIFLPFNLGVGVTLLIVSEAVGIVEELV